MRARRPDRGWLGSRDQRRGARRLRRAATASTVLAVGAVLLAGCGGPQSTFEPAGPVAREQLQLWNLVFPIAVVVFFLVQGLLLVALVRFRRRRDDDSLPKQVSGNTRLEVLWTIIPGVILAVIAIPTVRTIFQLAAAPADALEVRVVGKQYWWEFEYTGEEGQGIVTANELYIPTGRDVLLTLESTGQGIDDLDGVIHSFWVPKLAGKQDVIPGHQRTLSLAATEPGRYEGQCAEFCGLSHANMRFAVIAQEPAEFEAWVDAHAQPPPPPEDDLAKRGEQLFTERQCVACHAIGYDETQARVGPNLTYFSDRAKFAGYILENTDENLRAWVQNPQALKPGAQMPNLQLSDQDIDALVAYLRTLESPER